MVLANCVTIEFCGRLADIAPDPIPLEVPPTGLPILEVVACLAAENPALGDALLGDKIRACVDEAIVPKSFRVMPGSILAFFPPVSGG